VSFPPGESALLSCPMGSLSFVVPLLVDTAGQMKMGTASCPHLFTPANLLFRCGPIATPASPSSGNRGLTNLS
jgi:hypothetical protein